MKLTQLIKKCDKNIIEKHIRDLFDISLDNWNDLSKAAKDIDDSKEDTIFINLSAIGSTVHAKYSKPDSKDDFSPVSELNTEELLDSTVSQKQLTELTDLGFSYEIIVAWIVACASAEDAEVPEKRKPQEHHYLTVEDILMEMDFDF